MSDSAQHLLGRLVEGRFPLRKLLGVSPNSAVFLTSVDPERPGDPARDAAIKLVPEDPESSGLLLEQWRAAAGFFHDGLLKILYCGRCVLDGAPCLYLVTELADEDLGQLLPQRALTTDETRGMLAPVLEVLDYLHEQGMVHGGLKPSNIHAIGNDVKLAADRLVMAGESRSGWPLAEPFAAPESVLFPAADVWSLGATLCQTLTQKLPTRGDDGSLTVPEVPAPFAQIVKEALVDDPTVRVSFDAVRAAIDPNFVPKPRPEVAKAPEPVPSFETAPPEALIEAMQATATQASAAMASAGASGSLRAGSRAPLPQIDPLSVPLSPVEPPSKTAAKIPATTTRAPIPVSSLPQVNASIAGPRRVAAEKPVAQRSNRLFLAAAVAAVLLAIVVVPRLLLRTSSSNSRTTQTSPSTEVPAAPPSTSNAASSTARQPEVKSTPAQPAASAGGTGATPKEKTAAPAAKTSGAVVPAPSANSTAPPKMPSAKTSSSSPTVVRKILPEVSEKARNTISGTVRINVKVQLNPDGTVSAAELNAPASSQFFADLALKAARQWQFGPPAAADGSTQDATPSSTIIRFDFTQTGTAAYLP